MTNIEEVIEMAETMFSNPEIDVVITVVQNQNVPELFMYFTNRGYDVDIEGSPIPNCVLIRVAEPEVDYDKLLNQ